ncbi:restriction endonuclease [Actinomadura namibiensis]|uniref:restriction endonuclease n=1 Tax=Actinomadura kijaniata TaxID=46161 RepID=UPI0028B1B522|nr:restriction endonuclease [Actinomadura namibiensis]
MDSMSPEVPMQRYPGYPPPRRKRPPSIVKLALIATGAGVLTTAAFGRTVAAHPVLTALCLVLGLAAIIGCSYYLARLAERERHAIFEANSRLEVVDRMTGTQFEEHIAELLRRDGFTDVRVLGGAGDRGADITARDPDRKPVAVQCKRWSKPIGAPEVRNFIGALNATYDGHRGVFVASSGFTRQAAEEAALCGLLLVDRPHLARWLTGTPISLP